MYWCQFSFSSTIRSKYFTCGDLYIVMLFSVSMFNSSGIYSFFLQNKINCVFCAFIFSLLSVNHFSFLYNSFSILYFNLYDSFSFINKLVWSATSCICLSVLLGRSSMIIEKISFSDNPISYLLESGNFLNL